MEEGVEHFFTKVVGVTHKNRNGTSRQKVIRECALRQELQLRTGTDVRFPESIAVLTADGRQLGFVPSAVASRMCREMKKGFRFEACVSSLTGGTSDKPTHGANLLILKIPQIATDADTLAYLQANISELRESMQAPAQAYDGPHELPPEQPLISPVFWIILLAGAILVIIAICNGPLR